MPTIESPAPAAAGAAPPPGLRIVRLAARDSIASPQTLVVVGAARDPHDVWVSFEPAEPDDPLPRTTSPWSTRAAPVDLLPTPKGSADEPAPTREPPYDVDLAPGEWMWVARFDLPDHANLGDHWRWFAQQAQGDPAATILLRAWHARVEPPSNASVAEGTAPAIVPEKAPPVGHGFTLADVQTLPLFELGVLFVHGIGPHKVRETLIRFGEPIVLFWERWLRATTTRLAARLAPAARTRLLERLQTGGWRRKHDHERDLAAMKAKGGRGPALAAGGEPLGPGTNPACGTVTIEDTIFRTPATTDPSSTLARLSIVRADGEVREAHVLLSEAWWTGETFYPSFAELFTWITQALPVALRMHAAGVLRCSRQDLELARRRRGSSAWGGARVLFDKLVLLQKQLILLPLLVAWASLAQVGLLALLLLSLVPVDAIRGRIRGAVDLLLGTIGQSYALKTSSVRRNAIVRAVIRDLEFVAGKCQRVAVVSHSQGAEVARLVFQNRRWPMVRRWVTFGAGIVPLAALEGDREDEPQRRRVAALLLLCSVVVAAVGGLAIAELLFGATLPWLSTAAGWSRSHGIWIGIVPGVALAFMLSAPPWRSDVSRLMLGRWHDYYASHDPVPGGPIQDDATLAKESRIFNTRFALRDHTSYFENTEEFVAPVALDLFELAGLGTCTRAAEPALASAAARRDVHTWWRMALRLCAVYAFVAVVAATALRDSAARAIAWRDAAASAWASADGWAAWGALLGSGVAGRIALDLWPAWVLALAYFTLRPAWSAWWSARSRSTLFADLSGILDGDGMVDAVPPDATAAPGPAAR